MKRNVVLYACQMFLVIILEVNVTSPIQNLISIDNSEYFVCNHVEEKSSVCGECPLARYYTLKRLKFHDYSEWKRGDYALCGAD
jgi:hypothetical protein